MRWVAVPVEEHNKAMYFCKESGYMFGNLEALNADMKFIYSFFSLLCSDPELMLEIEMTQR